MNVIDYEDQTRHWTQQDRRWETRRRMKKERKKKQETGWVGGIYVHDVCDPQGRGLSPSLGCRGRTLTTVGTLVPSLRYWLESAPRRPTQDQTVHPL
jgi:hypothetical protein